MRTSFVITRFCVIALLVSSCSLASAASSARDRSGPEISAIETSTKVLAISDCLGTSVIISAQVTDASGIASVLLWYRVGSEQPFVSTQMELSEGKYRATLKGIDLQGNGYGDLEFYITAKDGNGNLNQSPVDKSVQFLPCVGH
jgi:hypothetical protein